MNQETKSKDIKVKWGSSDHLDTVYVNQCSLTYSGKDFYLTFGELAMPIISSPEDAPEELMVKPKVRIALSPKSMVEIVGVINEATGRIVPNSKKE